MFGMCKAAHLVMPLVLVAVQLVFMVLHTVPQRLVIQVVEVQEQLVQVLLAVVLLGLVLQRVLVQPALPQAHFLEITEFYRQWVRVQLVLELAAMVVLQMLVVYFPVAVEIPTAMVALGELLGAVAEGQQQQAALVAKAAFLLNGCCNDLRNP
jgi:hypothetical protein